MDSQWNGKPNASEDSNRQAHPSPIRAIRCQGSICSTSSLRWFHNRHSGFARSGYVGNPHRDGADLGLQYLRNCRPALRLLPGKPHITPRYPRLVRRWLFHLDCLRPFASHNPWLGVPHTATSQGCRAVTEQSTARLNRNGLWLGKKSWRDSWAPPTLSRLSRCPRWWSRTSSHSICCCVLSPRPFEPSPAMRRHLRSN